MNDRSKITAELVERAGELFAQGKTPEDVAESLGITPYLAGLLQENVHATWASDPPAPQGRELAKGQNTIDAATLRQVQRMLAVAWLPMSEIARQAGVDEASVRRIKAGQYRLCSNKSMIAPHERLLALPQRCAECGGLIYIVPCRLCAARQKIKSVNAARQRMAIAN